MSGRNLVRFLLFATLGSIPVLLWLPLPAQTVPAGLMAPALVVNTADDTDDDTCSAEHCSLREAINAANANPGPDVVAFNIPLSNPGYNPGGWWTIRPSNPLPELTDDGTTIDGTTQTANQGDANPLGPEIELDGQLAGVDGYGIDIRSGGNVVRGLVVNRFAQAGLRIAFREVSGNRVVGNYIGTDPKGQAGLGNRTGVDLDSGPHDNSIGGETPADRNVISGNQDWGVHIWSADGNRIVGNYIGPDAAGSGALGNGWAGVSIQGGSRANVVGPANRIAHNSYGIWISQSGTTGNTITRNAITSNGRAIFLSAGGNNEMEPPVITAASSAQVSGTACPGCDVELFSDSEDEGELYEGSTTADGDAHWTFTKPGGLTGPNLTATATDASGNTSEFSAPVPIADTVTPTATAPLIPTVPPTRTPTPTTTVPPTTQLVVNTADDTDDDACDASHCSLREAVIAANRHAGPDTIVFNIPPSDAGYTPAGWWTIRPASPLPELTDDGTTIDGTTQTANQGDTNRLGPEIELDGSLVTGRSQGLMVSSANNVIRGLTINQFTGLSKAIRLWGQRAAGNLVVGNYLGTDPTGTEDRGNDWGIEIWLSAHENTIGGEATGERNVISGNDQRGIAVGGMAHDNRIIGNFIGTTAQGSGPLGNMSSGIVIDNGQENIVGPANRIAFNGGGVRITGSESLGNTVTANSIHSNTEGIMLVQGANADVPSPSIESASATEVRGTACGGCRVEIFSDLAGEGAVYEGFTTAAGAGHFIFSKPGGLSGPNLTATATDVAGNTSTFSAPVAMWRIRVSLPLLRR